MKKIYLFVIASLFITMGMKTNVFAGEWKLDNVGWWYQNDDGSYQRSGWFRDADGKYYFFGYDGYMISDTEITMGYYVGSDGALISDRQGILTVDLAMKHLNANGLSISGYGMADGWYLFEISNREDVLYVDICPYNDEGLDEWVGYLYSDEDRLVDAGEISITYAE